MARAFPSRSGSSGIGIGALVLVEGRGGWKASVGTEVDRGGGERVPLLSVPATSDELLLERLRRNRRSVVGGFDAREGEAVPLLVEGRAVGDSVTGEAEENDGRRGQSRVRCGEVGVMVPKGEGGERRDEGLVDGRLKRLESPFDVWTTGLVINPPDCIRAGVFRDVWL